MKSIPNKRGDKIMARKGDLTHYEKYQIGMDILRNNYGRSVLARVKEATDSASGEVIHRLFWLNLLMQDINKANPNQENPIPSIEEYIYFETSEKEEYLPKGKIKFTTLIQNRQLFSMCVYGSDPEYFSREITKWNKHPDHGELQIDESYKCDDIRFFFDFFKKKLKEKKASELDAFVLTLQEQKEILEETKKIHPLLHKAFQDLFLNKDFEQFFRTLKPLLKHSDNQLAVSA
jgi:hypothetical protein